MFRTVWKKPLIRCTPNGNQERARSPSASAGTRRMTPGLAPRAVARYPAWSDHARKPPAQTPGRSITPATDSSHLLRRSSSTRPATSTHQKSAASPSRKSTSPLSKRTSSPAAIRSPSCSSLSPSNKNTPRRSSMSISRTCPAPGTCPRHAQPPARPHSHRRPRHHRLSHPAPPSPLSGRGYQIAAGQCSSSRALEAAGGPTRPGDRCPRAAGPAPGPW
jgi:hypothetical protein